MKPVIGKILNLFDEKDTLFLKKNVNLCRSARTTWEYQEYFKLYAYINHSNICLEEDSECQISYRITDGSKKSVLRVLD